MKFLQRVFIYCIVGIISVTLCFILFFYVEKSYVNAQTNLKEAGNERVSAQVESIISKIDIYRKYLPEETVKQIVHDTLDDIRVDGNQYVWINEVTNWDGGNKYAFRFAHPNFPLTEGEELSTTLTDSHGAFPYRTELQGIKENGEIYYQYYFKNYLNDIVELKYSYAQLYVDYNWIIACGIPQSDLFAPAFLQYQKEKQIMYLVFLLIGLIDVFICFMIHTQKKRREVENAHLITLAKAEAKNEFFSTLSHELRTPLNAIIGLNDLLRENCNDTKSVVSYSRKIGEASTLLLSLINDVLDLSAIEKGKMKIAQEEVSVKKIMYEISDIYCNVAEKKGLDFNVILDTIPHEELIGDPYRIRQILLNLLSNALKFTDTGSISLTVNEEQYDEKTVQLIFIIRDTGCGMPQSSIARLFEEFEQADASVARIHGGSGLGLAIVKSLVDAMHGTIEASSHLHEGSQFTVTLPLAISSKEEQFMLSCDTQTVLIVDEDEQSIRSLSHLCDILHLSTHSFTTAQQAFAYVHDHRNEFSVYFVSHTLPDMTGRTFASHIRKQCSNVPLIFIMSDHVATIDTQEDSSVSAYIQKPLFASELYELLIYHCLFDVTEPVIDTKRRYDGCKILSVEDKDMNQLIITKILEKLGIEVFVASDGMKAVDFMKNNLQKDEIDMILMDERMPLMDGLTATKKMRALHVDIPIVALSANAFKKDIERSLQSGMNAHLAKPLNKTKLYEILDTYLSPKVKAAKNSCEENNF